MTKEPIDKPTIVTSRRTGIDRRWIPSADHQPERRRGSERRKTRKRSFLEPLDANGSTVSPAPFPEITPNIEKDDEKQAGVVDAGQDFWRLLEAPSTLETTDEG